MEDRLCFLESKYWQVYKHPGLQFDWAEWAESFKAKLGGLPSTSGWGRHEYWLDCGLFL